MSYGIVCESASVTEIEMLEKYLTSVGIHTLIIFRVSHYNIPLYCLATSIDDVRDARDIMHDWVK